MPVATARGSDLGLVHRHRQLLRYFGFVFIIEDYER